MRTGLFTLLLAGLLGGFLPVEAAQQGSQQQTEQQLADVQAQIRARQREVDRQLNRAKELQAELKKAELAIGQVARELNQTEISLANNQAEQQALSSEQRQLQQQQSQQLTLLAEQLRSAYMAGNHDYLKLLFNQSDASRFERINSYYQYLNRARQAQIDKVRQLAKQLQQVNAKLLDSQQALQQLLSQQTQQRSLLTKRQQARKTTLTALQASISSDAAKIEQLQVSERDLVNAIEQASKRAAQDLALNGLAKLKGRLQAPADGRIRNLFGKRRQGQVRWKGMMVNGNTGSAIRAVHQGTVLYADWLKGFGLVTVIDHGKGYMSLYGHSQALLKQAGDQVEGGETIALLGQSGGQSSPGLYFEIRLKGKAINPKGWFARR